ncbi:hypothetical protein [Amycolatopsis sp. MtRt-6]|uniref:hypothetical protein n=1 Tax=Amycolatopsis sp. MtRt-6 TaxID=2792782 RepID=UPI001A8D66C1|nr:hypothetical protein [Amycolatopsis sp. MtRt-6]
MKFTSTKYPQLVVHDLGVTFVDGEAEVNNKAAVDALKALPPELGVRAAGGRPPKDPADV